MYQSSDLQKFFGRSAETIRQWADEFSTFLSEAANPPEGVHRRYDEQDLLVFALVNQMREQRATTEEIHASLESGNRGKVPVSVYFKENAQDLAVKLYQAGTELDSLRKQLDEAEQKLAAVSEENIRLKTQIEEMEKRIALEREVAALKARLEAMEKND